MTLHTPVLAGPVVLALAIKSDGYYVDCTFGRGGHSAAILAQLGPEGRLLALDRDREAAMAAERDFAGDARFNFRQTAFSDLGSVLQAVGWSGRVNGILLDLGVSSPQLDEAERGFSFSSDGPLDMRMDQSQPMTAASWLRRADEAEIAEVIWRYGEERFSRRIARAIIETRTETPLTRTAQLAELVARVLPGRERQKHPATRTFQALRIFINDELEELDAVLPQAEAALATGGRLVVLSFHSLEDRRVKQFFRGPESSHSGWPQNLPLPEPPSPRWRLVRMPRRADASELAANPRARSATLRVAERLPW
ncbi:MAG: 16S rRNA (cytosine(1402)-N(4))-methyltransferase RsmH [Gammaproteobacteria bacterium]|nr:16S rRNA (cytosine(1402)-N(4))-methyltransferase RsmH [Gammaproteobacteria bacterium]